VVTKSRRLSGMVRFPVGGLAPRRRSLRLAQLGAEQKMQPSATGDDILER
jgi:hypothetical protein